jgi:dTDP-4-dehydrorhamnose 3,5-epimerase
MTKQTIQGMHFQYPPHAEMKIVRCVKGSVFDVAVDLPKHESPCGSRRLRLWVSIDR